MNMNDSSISRAARNVFNNANWPSLEIHPPVPISEGLEWRLSQICYKCGVQAFYGKTGVPHAITNDGYLSMRTAEFLAEHSQLRNNSGVVVELGPGTGLFAKFVLEHLKVVSDAKRLQSFNNIRYLMLDASERMLSDILSTGILREHLNRVKASVFDGGMAESETLLREVVKAFGNLPIAMIICNYSLDSLPMRIVRLHNGKTSELHVRTVVGDEARFNRAGCSIDHLRALMRGQSCEDAQTLLKSIPMLQSEYVEVQIDASDPTVNELLLATNSREDGYMLLNSGAYKFLKACIAAMGPCGLILISDYGWTDSMVKPNPKVMSRFGDAVACGINFSLLEVAVKASCGYTTVAPYNEQSKLITRLVCREGTQAAMSAFKELFSGKQYHERRVLLARAQHYATNKALRPMREIYDAILEREPYNWKILAIIAKALQKYVRDNESALKCVEAALHLNPITYAELWVISGDLKRKGNIPGSENDYRTALRIDRTCGRARIGLALLYCDTARFEEALEEVGKALFSAQNAAEQAHVLNVQKNILNLFLNESQNS